MTKQELKEKILEIIDSCTVEYEKSLLDFFRYNECIEKIEVLFKEVE